MAYKIELLPEAAEDFHRLDKPIAQRVLRKLRWLAENFGSLTPEPLNGKWKDLLKLRVGSYRILYIANKEKRTITVHLIGHRKDIYKQR